MRQLGTCKNNLKKAGLLLTYFPRNHTEPQSPYIPQEASQRLECPVAALQCPGNYSGAHLPISRFCILVKYGDLYSKVASKNTLSLHFVPLSVLKI